MQIVDVLRDNRRGLAGAVEAGERAMAAARLGTAELVLHGETAPPGLVARLLAGEELVKRDRPVLGPQPARRAKVRYPTFGRDAGPGEWYDNAGFLHHVLQPRYGACEIGRGHRSTL